MGASALAEGLLEIGRRQQTQWPYRKAEMPRNNALNIALGQIIIAGAVVATRHTGTCQFTKVSQVKSLLGVVLNCSRIASDRLRANECYSWLTFFVLLNDRSDSLASRCQAACTSPRCDVCVTMLCGVLYRGI